MGSHIEEVAELMAADGKAAIKIGNANLPWTSRQPYAERTRFLGGLPPWMIERPR